MCLSVEQMRLGEPPPPPPPLAGSVWASDISEPSWRPACAQQSYLSYCSDKILDQAI